MSNSSQLYGPQHARPPCPSPTLGVYSNSCPLSRWCHPTISSFAIPFSSCSHEIKRRLLLGRKVMTNLDSIFKSRDITLPKKVHLVKAIVFPVVMYGCESWTIRKAECWFKELMLLNCGAGEDSWESLALQADPTTLFWRRSALGFLWKEWC